MSHANAALTPRARLRLARLVVNHGWPIARAAERYDVSWPTAKRWAVRCRINKLGHVDRRTGEPIRRYENDHPGSLLHDVTGGRSGGPTQAFTTSRFLPDEAYGVGSSNSLAHNMHRVAL